MSVPCTEPRPFDVVFVGNEHPIKGIDRLQEIVFSNPFLSFAIVGKVSPFCARSNVTFFGELKGAKKYKILKKSKVLVLPSYHESFSLVAVEAMSVGTPVVMPCIPTLNSIYNEGICMCNPLEPESWKSFDMAIHGFLDGFFNWSLTSQQAIEESKRFNWCTEARKVIE